MLQRNLTRTTGCGRNGCTGAPGGTTQLPRTNPCKFVQLFHFARKRTLLKGPPEKEKKGDKRKMHIAIVCDDFANERRVVRGGILEKLFLMGRHIFVSTYVLTQYYRLLSPALRTNAVLLACFKMRNIKDLESILEENSAIILKDQLREMYERSTSRPYGFLLLRLTESDPARTAYGSFETRLVPT